jgi:N-acetylglucosaminyldiphosphoundecaprenol N-acetyl-beta-D-mannosaminyltransferase
VGSFVESYRKRRYFIGDVPVDPLSRDEILDLVENAVSCEERVNLLHMNLHGLYCAQNSKKMMDLVCNEKSIIHVDGMPIVWIGKLFGKRVKRTDRNTHIDLVPDILRLFAARGWSVGFVGSRRVHIEENRRALESICSEGTYVVEPGYFNSSDPEDVEVQQILENINASGCKIVLVGLGMPRQEEWIDLVRGKIQSPVVMPVGGFLDYFAGRTAKPPRFLGGLGLEWLYRLVTDPRRLAFRYLIEPIWILRTLAKSSDGDPPAR